MDTIIRSERDSQIAQSQNKGRLTGAKPPLRPPVRFEITEQTRQAIDEYLLQRAGGCSPYLFSGRGRAGHLTTRQYARLLAEWLTMIGLDPRFYGTHSLRRTKPTLINKKTGNLRAVQLLLGHTKIESTLRYLGIEVDDALAVAEQIDG